MSIFGSVESGTSWQRSRFSKSISKALRYDCRFGEIVPVLRKFMLPGDVARIGGDVLVRFQPMMSPTLTRNTFKVRYFFVPLRLVEDNTELVVTGSKNGKVYTSTLPKFDAFITDNTESGHTTVPKYGFWDYMAIQTGDYSSYRTSGTDRACLPAMYWHKAYARIWFDFYRDENLQEIDDFDTWYGTTKKYTTRNPEADLLFVNLRKDYFSSSLPWQLKTPNGILPTVPVNGTTASVTWTPNFSVGSTVLPVLNYYDSRYRYIEPSEVNVGFYDEDTDIYGLSIKAGGTQAATGQITTELENVQKSRLQSILNQPQTVPAASLSNLGFNADDLRTVMAQTRVFERLARTGSRYVEYLRANFGTAPADDTLQRPQYLGGWSIPIVTTEVLQTGEGTNRVGSMYGHGITRGGNRIHTFHCKEFGLLFGLAHIIPDTEYTTGISRELTYKSRFDFYNPSFQHLSEQEVRKSELYFGGSPSDDNDTFGFQAIYNELRTDVDKTVGDLRGGLKFWTQALEFDSRPELNEAFIKSANHLAAFNKPFQFTDEDTQRPCIVLFQNYLDMYRPMVRYGTPGLVDHL